jgi:hypothetical protein
MTNILDVYHAHSLLAVAGVAKIYDVNEIPTLTDALGRVSWEGPVIVPVWEDATTETDKTVGEIGSIDETHTANFLCLISPVESIAAGLEIVTPQALMVEWAYRDAISRKADLGILKMDEAKVTMRKAFRNINGEDWFVIEITHQWRLLHDDNEEQE